MKTISMVLYCALLTCGAAAQTLNPAVTGGGTTNYIAKWSSSTNLTTSALCQSASGGSIGLGTCSPTQKLQVNSGNVVVKGLNNFAAKGQTANYYVGDTNHAVAAVYGAGLFLSAYQFPSAMVVHDSILINGEDKVANVGIGTTSPQAFLDIQAGNVHCGPNNCYHHAFSVLKVGSTVAVSDDGFDENVRLGDANAPGGAELDIYGSFAGGNIRMFGGGLVFPDGTLQTTAYTGAAATKQAAAVQQLQRDRDNLMRVIEQLQARVALLESARR